MGAFHVLNQNKDFRTLYYHGKSQAHPWLITYVRKNRLGITRVGITTSKKIGGAVQRSRSRRVIRKAYRQNMPQVRDGLDIVFVARGRTAACKSTQVAEVMRGQLQALGAIRPAASEDAGGAR